MARMVDIGDKPAVERLAVAAGRIRLRAATLEAIRLKKIKKGDVLAAAQLAGIQSAKRTSDIVPLCHPVPLSSLAVELSLDAGGATARCEAGALLCVWDMVKYIEKDRTGNYPATAIEDIRVLSKVKGKPGAKRPAKGR